MKRLLKKYLLLNNCSAQNHGKYLIALAVVCFCRIGKSQIVNYVNNGSFENLLPTANVGDFDGELFWEAIDTTSSSYVVINEASSSTSTGFQQPRTGNNFILTTFYCTSCSRWYPRNRLKQVLKPNTAYCAKYYIVNTNNNRVAIDSYGMYFGDGSLDTITQCSIPLTYLNPQIENQTGIITDTLRWTPITGTFVANGTEKYMLIGDFKSNAATNTLQLNTPLQIQGNDVYIDDVSLIELDLPADAGYDAYLVPGDSAFIGRQPDLGIDDDCMWYKLPDLSTAIDAVAGLWVKPAITTTYVVRQKICGIIKWDTVVVYKSAVGLEELKLISEDLKIFPVPAQDEITLQFTLPNVEEKFNSICIYNNLGQLLREEEIIFKNKSVAIKTSDLFSGVYQLQLKNNEEERLNKKFVITR